MKIFERASLALGLLLFGWLLHRVGLGEVWNGIGRIGFGFLAILALFWMHATVTAFAWRVLLPVEHRVPLLVLMGLEAAGNALNTVSPGVVGGEILRVSLLRRRVPTAEAAASVALAAGCQFAAQVLFVVAGLPWLIERLLGSSVRTGFLLFALFASTGLVFLAFLSTRSRLFERLYSLFARFVPRLNWGSLAAWRAFDASIFGALRERRAVLISSVSLHLAGWSLGMVETSLILRLLGFPTPWRTCMSIEVLAVILDAVFFFVPGHLGTEEGGRYAIFELLSLAPSLGFTVAVIKRCREVIWAAGGLAVLAFSQRRREPAVIDDSEKSIPDAAPGLLKPDHS